MLDKFYIDAGGNRHTHSHDHRVTVNEHRAPTDESIRLFQELQQKAVDSIARIDLVEFSFGEIQIIKAMDPTKLVNYYVARFVMGGETITVKYEPKFGLGFEKEVIEFRDVIAREIATRLVVKGSDQLRTLYNRETR